MWPEDDSDDDYDEQGRYTKRFGNLGLELVYGEHDILKNKNLAYDLFMQSYVKDHGLVLLHSRQEVIASNARDHGLVLLQSRQKVSSFNERGELRAYIERAPSGFIFDWRLFRVLSVLHAFTKFHEVGPLSLRSDHLSAIGSRLLQGSLDLSGRFPKVKAVATTC